MEEIGIFDSQLRQESAATPSRPISGGVGPSEPEEDLYIKFKRLQRQLEFIQVLKVGVSTCTRDLTSPSS